MIVKIPGPQIRTDDLDKRAEDAGFKPDLVVFPSRHSSASGMPALTVHTLGNYNSADLGGKPGTLVPSCPHEMSNALRLIKKRNDMPEFNVCFEATHHGPFLETPTYFIEIGSDEGSWGRKDAAALQASIISDVDRESDYPVMIGIGGGHYCPRFTEVALTMKADFGHVLPNYQMEGHDDEDIARMMRLAMEGSETRLGFLHRKSMKGAQATRLRGIAESIGLELLGTKDLEPIDGN